MSFSSLVSSNIETTAKTTTEDADDYSYSDCPCDKIECLVDWTEYYDPNDDEGDQWTHCERQGCHNSYWAFKNGDSCVNCHIKCCEGCLGKGKFIESEETYVEDGWWCSDCLPNRKEIIKQNKLSALKALHNRISRKCEQENNEKKRKLEKEGSLAVVMKNNDDKEEEEEEDCNHVVKKPKI
jgi:hypothetical protein